MAAVYPRRNSRASELILADRAEQMSFAARRSGAVGRRVVAVMAMLWYGGGGCTRNIPRKFEQLVYGINKPISGRRTGKRAIGSCTRGGGTQSKLLKAFSRRLYTRAYTRPYAGR